MSRAARLGVLVFAIIALRVEARWQFVLMNGETQMKGGQVCFLTVQRTADRDPRRFLFVSNDVRCHGADEPVPIPNQAFLFYAVHPDGYISPSMELSVPTGDAPPADTSECTMTLPMPLSPSATVDLRDVLPALGPGEYLAAWTSDTATAASMIYPVAPGRTSVTVPAERPFVILAIGDHHPTRISGVLRLSPRETRAFRFEEQRDADVVTWAVVDRQFLVDHLPRDRRRHFGPAASALIAADGRRIEPLFPMLHGMNIHGTLQIFKHVPPGAARIVTDGNTWTAAEVAVTVPASGVLLAPPVRTLPAAIIDVTYAAPAAGNGLELVLQQCAASCTDVESRPLRSAAGVERFTRVAAGKYTVALRRNGKITATQEIEAKPTVEHTATLRAGD